MTTSIEQALEEAGKKHADKHFHVFDITAREAEGGQVTLAGRVLDEASRQDALEAVRGAAPAARIDASGLGVLRQNEPAILSVATNQTSLQGEPGWMSEQTSQLLAGQRLELLEERGRWGFVRQIDGYLGWAYLPYLTRSEPLPATHIVLAPESLLLDAPQGQKRAGRVLGGTRLALVEQQGTWGRVSVFAEPDPEQPSQVHSGWLPLVSLRALASFPMDEEARRCQMGEDALSMTGVPYLWGGCTAGGIDCSGYAQLLHRWIGIEIPRDADDQYKAGQPIEPPFQPGDLLFFGEQGEQRRITHVTISLGGWNVIHSSRRRNGVYIDNVQEVPSLMEDYLCACTYLR